MISHIPFERILKKALAYGAEFAEIYFENSISTTITNDNKLLENVVSATDKGVGIRVVHNNHTTYGSSNDLDLLEDVADSVAIAARSQNTKILNIVFNKNVLTKHVDVKLHPSSAGLDAKIDAVLCAADTAWSAGKSIVQVRVVYRDKIKKFGIANSEGLLIDEEQVETVLYVHVVASNGKILQTGYEPVGGGKGFELLKEISPKDIASLASNRAIQMLDASPASPGPMTVVLSNSAGGTMIHEAVGHGLEADLASQGLSVYTNRTGEMVASSLVTVYDDATIKGRRGSFGYDDEGTVGQKICLIENGILKQYMSDRITSSKNGVQSKGNGRRESYAHPPIVRMTNTIIAPGQDDPEAIVRDTKKGLFVTRMGGGQVNTVNGDFTFEVQEAYCIENGAIKEPIRGATLIGNGPKVLETIDRVGADLGFSIGTCGKNGQGVPVESAQPTIRIPSIVVGGV